MQCEITGGGIINSLGYNVSNGDSCFLDQPSDLPNTNPLLGPKNESGFPVPMAGSPVIDIVPADMITFEGDSEPSLPWGTFTLTWTDCNTLTFEYASNVQGYGSATRNYQRITHLSGVDCPLF